MCFSARVKQKFEQLSRHHGAEVDWEAFDDLFRRRADGEDVKVARALELNYLNSKTEIQERSKSYIDAKIRAEKGSIATIQLTFKLVQPSWIGQLSCTKIWKLSRD